LIMDIPEGIQVTLVRDATDSMRPVRTENDGIQGVELGMSMGEILPPITVTLKLLMKKKK
jgi:hypothetical protein